MGSGNLYLPEESIAIVAPVLAHAVGYLFSWGNAANWASVVTAGSAAV